MLWNIGDGWAQSPCCSLCLGSSSSFGWFLSTSISQLACVSPSQVSVSWFRRMSSTFVTLAEVLEARGGPLEEDEVWSLLLGSAESLLDLSYKGKTLTLKLVDFSWWWRVQSMKNEWMWVCFSRSQYLQHYNSCITALVRDWDAGVQELCCDRWDVCLHSPRDAARPCHLHQASYGEGQFHSVMHANTSVCCTLVRDWRSDTNIL